MSKVLTTMESPEDVVGKPTLVGRVSNMLKDGNASGPPMLFRHASMQKIRHCCQNLNLFPYLLYSFDNSKSHPIARKVHLCLSQFLQLFTARIFLLYKFFRLSLLHGFRGSDELDAQEPTENAKTSKPLSRFCATTESQQKCKRGNALFLILGVYLAPLVLAFQLVGLFAGLSILRKYTPGFLFLIFALIVLSYITFKVLSHEDNVTPVRKSERIKTD